MNKRQAKAYVLRLLAAEARHHKANGSAWMFFDSGGEEFTDADAKRIASAVEEIADELERRAKHLTGAPSPITGSAR